MRFHRVVIGVGLLVVAAPAGAQRVDDVPAAREHYAKGKRLYDLGRFADAAKEYEAAYQAKDDPALLYNLGQAHRLAHENPAALLAYKAYLRNVPDAPNRAEVEQRITELQTAVDAQERARQAAPPPSTPKVTTTIPAPAPAILVTAPPPPRRSIAKKPWFWAVVVGGAAVVATGIAVGVVYGRRDPVPTSGSVSGP